MVTNKNTASTVPPGTSVDKQDLYKEMASSVSCNDEVIIDSSQALLFECASKLVVDRCECCHRKRLLQIKELWLFILGHLRLIPFYLLYILQMFSMNR